MSRQFFWRSDYGVGRTVANCLLMGVFLFFVGVFLSCRERQFTGEIITPQMAIEPRFQVRVLLADYIQQCTLRVSGDFSVLDGSGKALIPDTIFTEQGVPMQVVVSNGGFTIGGRNFPAAEVTILPDIPYVFAMDGNDYRGKLVLKVKSDGITFEAINVVPLEPYLAGVVGAEMPDYWQPESLKAQAIAARTYCLYNMRRFGPGRNWDVTRTTASQVYGGLREESSRTWQAVNDTLGQVLVCRQNSSSPRLYSGPTGLVSQDIEEIFPTYYSSSCGGHTEDAKNVFGDLAGPLCGVDCSYCKDVARPNVFFWPMAQFDKALVTRALHQKYPKLVELGDVAKIEPVKQSDYKDFSRLTMVKLVGSTGKSEFLRGEDLRLTIDPTGKKLRSISCKIITMDDKFVFLSGRGFGHGVGMCQCGAEGMARQGKTAVEILSHYYPGAKVTRAY